MMAKLGEGDTAWIAADRAAALAEASGDALAVAASMCRMAHVFLSLDQIVPAQQAAAATAAALETPHQGRGCYAGGPALVWRLPARARHHGRTRDDRASAYQHLDLVRQVAEKSATAVTTTAPNSGPSTSPSTP